MQRFTICILLAISSLAPRAGFGQEKDLSKKLTAYSGTWQREEVVLHTTSALYLTGETLHFKAYCKTISTGLPSRLSRIAYVELIDADHKSVLSTKISLNDGAGYGDFFLPSTLSTGNYILIAYTRWMLNDPGGNFFRTELTIVNPFRKPSKIARGEASSEFSIQAEGGRLVSGVENVLHLEARHASGRSLNISGRIIDETGATVADVKPTVNGRGNFLLTPAFGKIYKAVLTDSSKNAYFAHLPAVENGGVSLQLAETESAFRITLRKSQATSVSRVRFLAQSRGVPSEEGTIDFRENAATVELPKGKVPPFSTLTFFDSENGVIAELNLPGTPGAPKAISVKVNAATYRTRNKVELTLSGPVSNVLVSVRLAENTRTRAAGPEHSRSHIFHQGWTNQYWTEVLDSKKRHIEFLPDLRGDLISGSLVDGTGKAMSNELVFFSMPSTEFFFAATRTDSTGKFYFSSDRLQDSREVYLNVRKGDSVRTDIHMDNDFMASRDWITACPVFIDSADRKAIEKRSIYTQVENAYFEFKKDSVLPNPYSRFYGKPDDVYLLDDFNRFPTMEDVLREFVTSVIVRKKDGHFTLKVMDKRSTLAFKGDPLILLDGIPVFNTDVAMNYDPLKIKKIEVVMHRYFYGPLDVDGIISIVTYEGEAKNIPTMSRHNYVAVQPMKSYYSPDYSSGQYDTRKPDYRIQLYWNPSVTLSGTQKLEFYTSDVQGDYEVVVQGVQPDGKWVQGSAAFKVEE